MKKPIIYLDYAAATPMDPQVVAAMQPYFVDDFYNPSAQYLAAKAVKQVIETARKTVASYLGAKPSEIIFTAGGTEANNLAICGIMSQFPDGEMIVSAIEHESVLQPARAFKTTAAPVTPDGLLDVAALQRLITDNTVLVSIMYANNEIGTIQPLRQVAQLLETVRAQRQKKGSTLPILLHTDSCQAGAYLDLHTSRLGVDLMTINAGKIYGPKQCGALFVKSGVALQPLIKGGGQERGMRSGTENVAGVVGFAKALELAQQNRKAESDRLQQLQKSFIARLEGAIPSVIINGSRKHRLPNNIHITIPGHDNERLMMQLDEHGIMCATGSACSASTEEPSHVLAALGLPTAAIQSSLRFSMGRGTSLEDIKTTVAVLKSCIC